MRRYPDRGLHGRVVDGLGLRIVRGDIRPGEILDVDELAAGYDVSRTVVREALKVLAGKGLIDARPRRGTYARERENWNLLDPDVLRWQFDTLVDPTILDRLHEVRVMVEPAAAELAAARRTDADLDTLTDAVDAMAAADSSAETIAEADLRFHLGLIAATHNDLVEQLSVVIGIGLSARDQYVHTHRVSIERGLDRHRRVVEAVRHQDAPAAREHMLDLLHAAASDVRELDADDSRRSTVLD